MFVCMSKCSQRLEELGGKYINRDSEETEGCNVGVESRVLSAQSRVGESRLSAD